MLSAQADSVLSSGVMLAFRNPRAHTLLKDADRALEYIRLISLLREDA